MSHHPFAKRALFFTALLLAVVTVLPVRAADRVSAGQYQFTATTDGKAQDFTYCITAEEAAAVNGDAKVGRAYTEKAGKGACTVTAYDVNGDTVSYTMKCGDSVTKSSSRYRADTFEGDMTTTVTVAGKPIVRTAHTTAKRLGACK